MNVGMIAGLMYSANKITKEVQAAGKIQIPHMLHEQLQWITKSPPAHPTCSLSVEVFPAATKPTALIVPPSAYKRRNADLESMADTKCQACCMGRRKMQALGQSELDLIAPVLNLKAANSTGITI